jgi:multicomponent K+:H+ antiporter subunit E
MTRLLPFPLATAGLFAAWLLLNQALSFGQLLLGAAAALAGGWALRMLQSPRARIRRFGAVLRLSLLVLVDIVRSNTAVGRIILGLAGQGRRSGFVDIPLELRDPYGLATLACIITSTPGTLWVGFDAAQGRLTIHVLDLVEESDWISTIKGRYERLLMEIFE